MKAKEFDQQHLTPTLKELYGAEWQGHVKRHEHKNHVVIDVKGVQPNSPEHMALRGIAPDLSIHRALLGDNCYSFVVER